MTNNFACIITAGFFVAACIQCTIARRRLPSYGLSPGTFRSIYHSSVLDHKQTPQMVIPTTRAKHQNTIGLGFTHINVSLFLNNQKPESFNAFHKDLNFQYTEPRLLIQPKKIKSAKDHYVELKDKIDKDIEMRRIQGPLRNNYTRQDGLA